MKCTLSETKLSCDRLLLVKCLAVIFLSQFICFFVCFSSSAFSSGNMETNSSHQEDITLPSIMFNQVLTTIRGSVTNGTESTGWSLGHTTTLDDVTTHNTSIPPFFSQTTLQDHQINWSFVVIYCAVILVILAGNGLVVTAFFRFSFLQTVTNMFVVGVAITDALMACVGILRILTLIDPRLLSGYVPCMIRMGSGVINGVLSALMLTCKWANPRMKRVISPVAPFTNMV